MNNHKPKTVNMNVVAYAGAVIIALALFGTAAVFETKSEKFVLQADGSYHRDTYWRPLYRACYIASAVCFIMTCVAMFTTEDD